MAWKKNTTKTLTATTAGITTDVYTPTKFNMSMFHGISASASTNIHINYGTTTIDTGTVTAMRESTNGSADSTNVSRTDGYASGASIAIGLDGFVISYMVNLATEEKLSIHFIVVNGTSGAGTAPNRGETVQKYTGVSTQVDIMKFSGSGSGTLITDSNATILGTD